MRYLSECSVELDRAGRFGHDDLGEPLLEFDFLATGQHKFSHVNSSFQNE